MLPALASCAKASDISLLHLAAQAADIEASQLLTKLLNDVKQWGSMFTYNIEMLIDE